MQIGSAPERFGRKIRTLLCPIDRHALVSRHDVVVHEIDPAGVLAVGNGEFAFNCDVTGMQSFPEYYEKTMPVGTLSTWGWHSFPNPDGYTLDNFKMTAIRKYDREFVYPSGSTSHPGPQAAYLRGNPHRFGLGSIALRMVKADGSNASITDLKNIEQKLDLWDGVLTSSFQVETRLCACGLRSTRNGMKWGSSSNRRF